jgi:hypothetical protein
MESNQVNGRVLDFSCFFKNTSVAGALFFLCWENICLTWDVVRATNLAYLCLRTIESFFWE